MRFPESPLGLADAGNGQLVRPRRVDTGPLSLPAQPGTARPHRQPLRPCRRVAEQGAPLGGGGLSVEENIRLAIQARSHMRYAMWCSTASLADLHAETAEFIRYLGLAGIENADASSLSYGGQRLLDMGLAQTQPRILLLDEPLAGLAVAERERIAKLIKTISIGIPILLVEHDRPCLSDCRSRHRYE